MRVGILTVSDRSYRGEREDLGGPALERAIGEGWGLHAHEGQKDVEVAQRAIVPDERAEVAAKLIEEKGSIKRPYLGIRSQAVPLPKTALDALKGKQETGLLLVSVEKGMAAEGAGSAREEARERMTTPTIWRARFTVRLETLV